MSGFMRSEEDLFRLRSLRKAAIQNSVLPALIVGEPFESRRKRYKRAAETVDVLDVLAEAERELAEQFTVVNLLMPMAMEARSRQHESPYGVEIVLPLSLWWEAIAEARRSNGYFDPKETLTLCGIPLDYSSKVQIAYIRERRPA